MTQPSVSLNGIVANGMEFKGLSSLTHVRTRGKAGDLRGPSLPQLTIPVAPVATTTLHPGTPETPASLNSPITGIIDLTQFVKTLDVSPVTAGGFSDIHKGEWMRVYLDDDEREKKIEVTPVAIKILRILTIRDQDGVKARKRLNREVYVWHRLEHPNIVKLFGTSYHMSGRPSMVMQWHQNGSASDYLKGRGYSEVDRLALVLDVARGLKYLHTLECPIVHGDLKGNNVLITDEGRAVLSDFGLSKVMEDLIGPTGYTPSNPEVGPLRWQALEFLEDDACKPGFFTDIWSFGCTAYELLTSNIPYYYRLRDVMVIRDIQSGIKPPGCDGLVIDEQDKIHKMIQDLLYDLCWSFDPSNRQHMVNIVPQIEHIHASRDHLRQANI